MPEPVHATLRARAASAGMALSEYVLRELIAIAERPTVTEVLDRAAGRSATVAVEDVVAAVRAGRDR